MTLGRILLRVDGGPLIGYGHAVRTFALGTALARLGYAMTVLTRDLSVELVNQAKALGFEVVIADVGSSAWSEAVESVDAVIIDGYPLGAEMIELAELVSMVIAIDDNRDLPVEHADVVLNQNSYATSRMYADTPNAILLLGTEYALLRDEVRALIGSPDPRQGCFVSFGGADPYRLTLPTVERLHTKKIHTVVAYNIHHPDAARLDRLVATSSVLSRDGGNLTDSLGTAQIGIIGAGTTLYEVAAVGIPTVAVMVADNQRRGGAEAAQRGWVELAAAEPVEIVAAATRLLGDRSRQLAMSTAGSTAVDGRGSDRVAAVIRRHLHSD